MKAKRITRTINSSVVSVKGLDTNKDEVINDTVIVPGVYKDNADVLKVVKRLNLPYTPVSATVTSEVTKRYAMTEEKFIANAEEIDK